MKAPDIMLIMSNNTKSSTRCDCCPYSCGSDGRPALADPSWKDTKDHGVSRLPDGTVRMLSPPPTSLVAPAYGYQSKDVLRLVEQHSKASSKKGIGEGPDDGTAVGSGRRAGFRYIRADSSAAHSTKARLLLKNKCFLRLSCSLSRPFVNQATKKRLASLIVVESPATFPAEQSRIHHLLQ